MVIPISNSNEGSDDVTKHGFGDSLSDAGKTREDSVVLISPKGLRLTVTWDDERVVAETPRPISPAFPSTPPTPHPRPPTQP